MRAPRGPLGRFSWMRLLAALIPWPLVLSPLPDSSATAADLVVKSALVRVIERVDLSVRVDGVMREVKVQEGDRVKAGDLLAQIDDDQARVIHERAVLEARVARMEAENDVALREAQGVLEVAQRELERAQQTVRRVPGSISESKLDLLRLAVDKGVLAVERARRELAVKQGTLEVQENLAEEAEISLRHHQIVSPIDGVVAAVEKRVGETLTVGDKTFRVVNDQRLRVEGFLATADYRPGLAGRPATLVFPVPNGFNRRVDGEVVFVSPENDPHNGEIRVWIEFDNLAGQWRPGMRPQVTIHVAEDVSPASRSAIRSSSGPATRAATRVPGRASSGRGTP